MRSARGYRFKELAGAESLKRELQSAFPELLVQVVDSGIASNERLLEMIEAQTTEASSTGSPLAKKPEVDLLLRLAGTTQINEAIEKAGAKSGRPFLLIVAGDETRLAGLESTRAAAWDRLPRSELTTEDLARIEKAALLDVERA